LGSEDGRRDYRTEISVAEGNALPRERTQRDRTESLANEPESPAAKAPIAFLGVVATFFNYGATLYPLRVPAWSISEIDSPLRVEHVRDYLPGDFLEDNLPYVILQNNIRIILKKKTL